MVHYYLNQKLFEIISRQVFIFSNPTMEIVIFITRNSAINNSVKFSEVSDKILQNYCQIIWLYLLQFFHMWTFSCYGCSFYSYTPLAIISNVTV